MGTDRTMRRWTKGLDESIEAATHAYAAARTIRGATARTNFPSVASASASASAMVVPPLLAPVPAPADIVVATGPRCLGTAAPSSPEVAVARPPRFFRPQLQPPRRTTASTAAPPRRSSVVMADWQHIGPRQRQGHCGSVAGEGGVGFTERTGERCRGRCVVAHRTGRGRERLAEADLGGREGALQRPTG